MKEARFILYYIDVMWLTNFTLTAVNFRAAAAAGPTDSGAAVDLTVLDQVVHVLIIVFASSLKFE